MASDRESIVLGGGCFWCIEACFNLVDGVIEVMPGYAGGTSECPDYKSVCGGLTGHAEVVSVDYDPARVSLRELLEVFFASHDPTTRNRQGGDVGSQYRSIILYTTEEQEAEIYRFLEELSKDYSKPVVTEVKPLEVFHPAEEYHRRYFEKNPDAGYCQAVVAPKVHKVAVKLGKD
jgi:methionine-S-sulfoxide reductase